MMSAPHAKETAPGDRKRTCAPPAILLVDDEKEIRELLSEMLQMRGYAVTAVGSGAEALCRLEAHPFDLVITDLGMEGTSGVEVAGKAKATRNGIPVILITGWAEDEKELSENTADIDQLVPKPFTLAELGNTVDNMLGNPTEKD